MTPHDPIDSAINAAASRLTSATPSDALRANVMSRIAADTRATSRLSFLSWRYVFAGGAVAAVALIAFATLRDPAIPNRTIPTPTLISPAVINSTASANPTVSGAAASPLPSVVRTAALDSGRLVIAANEDGLNVPALERPELMTPVKPLLEGSPIKTIDIEPIRVAPLVVRAIDDDNQ